MFNFLFLSLISIIVSLSNYEFKIINSDSYIEFNINDTFLEYTEKTEEIKIEIFNDNSNYNSSLLYVYQYINKEDVRQDSNTKQYINFVYYSTFENNNPIKKHGNYFIITNNNPKKQNLTSTIYYISFMPYIPKDKIVIDYKFRKYLRNERVNKYMNIEYNKTYHHLFIHSNDNSLIFFVGNSTCIEPSEVCEIILESHSNSLETTSLKFRNSNLMNNSSAIITIILCEENKNEFEIDNKYIQFYYFKNFSKSIKFKHPELYNKFNESAFIWATVPQLYNVNIISSMDKIDNTFWRGYDDILHYFYYFKINKNNNTQEISFKFEYTGKEIGYLRIVAVPPTEIINYPFEYPFQRSHSYNVEFIRIQFVKSIEKKNLYLSFSDSTICLNRTSDSKERKYCKTFDLNNVTANTYLDLLIYDTYTSIRTLKNITYKEINPYEFSNFTINKLSNEISFYYKLEYRINIEDIYITFLEGPKSDNFTYMIINGETNFNLNKNDYDNIIIKDKFKENQKVIKFRLNEDKMIISLILIGPTQTENNLESYEYNDYISIRQDNIIINEDVPYKFFNYNKYNYIVYQFNITKSKKYRIEISFDSNTYLAELYQNEPNFNESSLQLCHKESYCKFELNNISSNVYVTVKQEIQSYERISHQMYVLLTEDCDFESINYGFKSKVFNKKFNYKYTLESLEKLNFTTNDELGFVLKTKRDQLSYLNMQLSTKLDTSLIEDEKNLIYGNYIFKYVYLSLSSLDSLSFNISYDKEGYNEPIEIAFSYIQPSINIILGKNKSKIETKYIEGIPIYVKLIKEESINSDIKYIIGVSEEGEYYSGNIIDGIKSNNFINIKKKYFFSTDYSSITTFRFNLNNPQLAYTEINGEYILYDVRPFNQLINFTFNGNETKYFIGIYSSIQFKSNLTVTKNDNFTFSIIGQGDINSLYEEIKFENYISLNYSLIDIIKIESKGIGNITLNFTEAEIPSPPTPTPPTPTPTPTPSSDKGSNAFWIILIIIILVFIIGGFVIYVFVNREKEPNMASFVGEDATEMIN